MISETIEALNKNKLHEVVVRVSQMSIKQLEKLLVDFLINDYALMYKMNKKEDVIIYEFDLPSAYTMTFKLYEKDKYHYMSLDFYYETQIYDNVIEEMLDCEYYELKLIKKNARWQNITDKTELEYIIKLIKKVV